MTGDRLNYLTQYNPIPQEQIIKVEFRFRNSEHVWTEFFPPVNIFNHVSTGSNVQEAAENAANARRLADIFKLTVAPFAEVREVNDGK